MSDLLQRMIARTHAPLSRIEPILSSVFTLAPSALEVESAIDATGEVPASAPTATRALKRVLPNTPEPSVQSPAQQEERADDSEQSLPVEETEPEASPSVATAETRTEVQAGEPQSPARVRQLPTRQFRPAGPAAIALQPRRERSEIPRPRESPERSHEVERSVAPAETKTEVFISIGQIELRSAPPAQPAPVAKPQRSMLSLQEYLRRRQEEVS